MALGFEDGSGLVVDDLVGLEDVGSIVDNDVSLEGEDVADAGLAIGFKLDGDASGRLRLGLRDGEHFLAGIVGELAIGVV